EHGDAGEADDLEVAGLDRGAAERYEQLLVGLHLLRVEMPVTHRHARLVGRVGLGKRWASREAPRQQQRRNECFHNVLLPGRLLVLVGDQIAVKMNGSSRVESIPKRP